jgi:hypothetical protein
MDFLKRKEKPPEKVKVAKANLPSHAADTNATCFKCGKVGHLRKDCKDGKTTMSQSGGFCSGCGVKGHNEAKCWKLHPELKPTGTKGTKAGGNEKAKETKASIGDKKGWKAKFADLESKMAAMSATTTSDEGFGNHGEGPNIGSFCKHSEPNSGTKGYSTRSKFKPGSTT